MTTKQLNRMAGVLERNVDRLIEHVNNNPDDAFAYGVLCAVSEHTTTFVSRFTLARREPQGRTPLIIAG